MLFFYFLFIKLGQVSQLQCGKTAMQLISALLYKINNAFIMIKMTIRKNYLNIEFQKNIFVMKKLNSKNQGFPTLQSSQTPSPFFNIEALLNPVPGIFEANMQTQDELNSFNPKALFQKLQQKNSIQDNSITSKTTRFMQETEYANNSRIREHSEIVKNLSQLKTFLNLNKTYDLNLIYRASQHNFDVSKFHQLCRNIPKTLVLAQINNGNIFGGFSTLYWNDQFDKNGTYYKTDKNQQSFIFNYTTRQKYKLIKQINNKAILASKYLGPSFGGYDFSIGNFANKKFSSTCDFPISYSKQIPQKNYKMTRRTLIGIGEQNFLIKEWQVFSLITQKNKKTQESQQINPNSKDFLKKLLSFFHSTTST